MRKSIFICLIALTSYTAALSAGNNLPVIRWGIKAGVTQQKYDVAGYAFGFEEQLGKPRPGFQVGIAVNFGFTTFPMHIQGELLYETVSYSYDSGSGTSKLRHNRILVPVMAGTGLELWEGGVLKAYVGPVFNILSSTTEDGSENITLDNALRLPLVGLSAGLGLEIGKFTADFRYNFHSAERNSEIIHDKNNTSSLTVKQKGHWVFTVGVLF